MEYVDNLFSKNAPDQMFSGFGKTPIERIDGINKSFWPLFDTKFKSNILGLYEHCLKKLSKEQRQFGINSYQEQEKYVQKWEERLNQVKSLNNEFFTTESILNIAKNQDNQFPIRQKAFDILTALIENGEASISEEFGSIIQKRGEQKEISESKWGLDPTQESAFYTLMRLDNPDSNNALFSLLFNEDVDTMVKYAVLKKLSSEKRNFLNKNNRDTLKKWLYSKKTKELDWKDLKFIKAISDEIPSTELKNLSMEYMGDPIEKLSEKGKSSNQIWQEKYNNIPENAFLQVYRFTNGDEVLLDKFQKLYGAIRKENTKKENLLYGIVNSIETNPQVLGSLFNKLKEIDFTSKQDADLLSELLRQTAFLNKIELIKNYSYYEEDEYYNEETEKETTNEKQELPNEIIKIFSKKIKNLGDLIVLLKEVTTKKIQEILPHKEITAEKIGTIEKQLGNLEPIFTYLGRYPELKSYIAEIIAHIDSKENWKEWRYDLENETVKKQIGHLSEQQLETWKGDYFSEIGDIMIAGESGAEKPKQIQNILAEAIITHKHIYDPEREQNKNKFIQKTLEKVYGEIEKNPDKQEEIIQKEIENISSDTKQIDIIIQANNIPRIEQSLQKVFLQGKEIDLSKKAKDTVNFLSGFLPKESAKILKENYDNEEQQGKKVLADNIITSEIRQILEQEIQEIQTKTKEAENSDIWDKHALDKTKLKNLGQFYQKRQELKVAVDLLRLNGLSNKLIATNRIVEKEGKKGGETLLNVVDNLQKYFKDSPLQQDIKNIEFLLKEKSDLGEKRRLAMMFTDNPQTLWQVGKYPLGNGSCQHYAEGSYANQLMGYVGDANCKVAYLVDLNKLPQNIKEELNEKEFEEIKDKIPAQDLLNACVARSLVKMTKDKEKQPVILLEPTYSKVYKSDTAMDKYFNLFVDLMVTEPMKAKMARGGGKESVVKGYSRSSKGQYEDLDLSSVKFINKLSKPTKEDEEIMERIRSSG